MSAASQSFTDNFFCLTGYSPMPWQRRLFAQFMDGKIPAALDLPTGLGKTTVMAIWLAVRALTEEAAPKAIPHRLIYIVDRRAVVDQATEEAEKLRDALDCNDTAQSKAEHLKGLQPGERAKAFVALRALKKSLRIGSREKLAISTLRGQYVDNHEWLNDPAVPVIVVGTVDMIGSRLLFEGYGVSRKMRPYHAGLLGVDTLIVLDESHLVPPFADLLRAIEGDPSLWPRDRTPLPRFIVLPLSATQRERPAEESGCKPFGLEEADWRDATASQRLNARKQLRVKPLAEKDHDGQLAEAAFALATKGRPARVAVFCNRREQKDDGAGPSAQGVAKAIEALAKGGKKAGHETIDIDLPELLVGARRVRERQEVADRLRKLGFTGHAEPPERPAFLVATSAGEVGIDLDADHLVCDLVPWERMVQRLGRVNRRGGEGREAHVVVFDTSGIEKDEPRKTRLIATRALLGRIETDFGGRAGSATLLELRGRVGPREIEEASTPEPLHPALTRAVVDAWSMTSLEHHTGRPEIAPWLRGWVEEKPQTIVVWRKYLPLRSGDSGQTTFSSTKETNEFFDSAPPHEGEKLETETYRVAEWLHDRADTLLQRKPPKENVELQRDDIVLLILSPSAEYERHLTLGDLAQDRKGRAKDEFHDALATKILVVDARFGGLKDGMLDGKEDNGFPTADASDKWSEEARFRVRQATSDNYESNDDDWRFEDDFVLRSDGTGDPEEWLVVEHYKSAAQSEEARSVSRPQELGKHQSEAEQKAEIIGRKVGLSGTALEVLMLAARLHDEGKRAERWQRAFRAERDVRKCGLTGPLAKTRGPINQKILDGYRHEFGSLAVFEPGHAWAKRLPGEIRERIASLRDEEWLDLVIHLVASHHGFARPVIGTSGCEDAPPSALDERAREVALRFARLQKHWGPWGLAWWEALLRAADQQASRDNDRREGLSVPHAEEE